MTLGDVVEGVEPRHLWTCSTCQKAVTSLEEGCPECGKSENCTLTNGKVRYQLSDKLTIGVRLDRSEHREEKAEELFRERYEEEYDSDWEIIEDEEYARSKVLSKLREEVAYLNNPFIRYSETQRALADFKEEIVMQDMETMDDWFSEA